MLIIRFSRVGKRNHAQYRIVLTEKSSPIKGKFVELLGSYDPHQKQAVLKEERVKYWLEQGVQCSDSVFNLLVGKGLINEKKRTVKIPEKEEAEKPAEEKATEAVKKDEEEIVPVEEKTEVKEAVVENKKEESVAETKTDVVEKPVVEEVVEKKEEKQIEIEEEKIEPSSASIETIEKKEATAGDEEKIEEKVAEKK